MGVRPAVFARQGWYPQAPGDCRAALDAFRQSFPGAPTGSRAGIVPHAGWVFSGQLAAWTFLALSGQDPAVVFLFGGHMPPGGRPSCMPEGAFETPLGQVPVHADLAAEIVRRFDCRVETAERFEPDNTIELQLPILKYVWPAAQVVAVQVPADPDGLELGAEAARLARSASLPAVAIGSTDLTHYGPHYGFSPKGSGQAAHDWSKQDNDRPYIDHLLSLDPRAALDHALAHHSACCPGAAGAAARFAAEGGAKSGELIAHTTSHEIEPRGAPQMWVGYAGIVY